MFVITTKDIFKKEFLWCDYGQVYHKALKQSQDYQQQANENRNYVVGVLGNDNFENQQISYFVYSWFSVSGGQ